MAKFPLKSEINIAVLHAHEATSSAANLRCSLRRRARPGSPPRQAKILDQLDKIAIYANDLRRLSGRIQWPQFEITARDEIRLKAASAELDRERRKLRKMLR